jgi:hypothetical protein
MHVLKRTKKLQLIEVFLDNKPEVPILEPLPKGFDFKKT